MWPVVFDWVTCNTVPLGHLICMDTQHPSRLEFSHARAWGVSPGLISQPTLYRLLWPKTITTVTPPKARKKQTIWPGSQGVYA